MKREDIRTRQQGDTPFFPNLLGNGKVEVCLKEDVDHLLNEKDAEIESMKATHDTEMMDAGMRERRLRRALYKACANWAHFAVAFFSLYTIKNRWHWMELKCLKKLEEWR